MRATYETLSEEEYLIREPQAEHKSEFRDGEVVAMVGASVAHSLITVNLTREISWQLKDRPCRTYSSDTRIKVSRARFYTYPDLSVVCGESVFDLRDKTALTNPTLIVEVLSPSTEDYDRGDKFKYYKKLDSLQEYVLVAQDRVCVERFSRQESGRWKSATYESLDDTVELLSIGLPTVAHGRPGEGRAKEGCRIAVRDVYDKVDLS